MKKSNALLLTGQAEKLYKRVAPIFQKANIDTEAKVSERAGHATDIAEQLDLNAYDSLICVGGDGFASEGISHG